MDLKTGEYHPCEICGKPVYQPPSYKKAGRMRFCSNVCRGISMQGERKERLLKICSRCKKPFPVLPCRYNKVSLCQECKANPVIKVPNTCLICGAIIFGKGKKYCSVICYYKAPKKTIEETTTEVTCQSCGKKFRTKNIIIKYGQGRYCSHRCWGKEQTRINLMIGHSRAHGGKREDLNGAYFRSSWESNYARYLNWLIGLGEIKKWEYECDTFEFKNIRKGNIFYTPDFKITNNDGSIEYHEIKGWMDARSKTKLNRMSKYFPEIKVILIDREAYYAIARSVKGFIPGWEHDGKHST